VVVRVEEVPSVEAVGEGDIFEDEALKPRILEVDLSRKGQLDACARGSAIAHFRLPISRAPHELSELDPFEASDVWDCLDPRGAVADYRNPLMTEIDLRIPPRRMPLLAFERVNAGQRRDDGLVKSSRGGDEDLGIYDDGSGGRAEGDVVHLLDLVPGGGLKVVLEAEAISEAVCVDNRVPVCSRGVSREGRTEGEGSRED